VAGSVHRGRRLCTRPARSRRGQGPQCERRRGAPSADPDRRRFARRAKLRGSDAEMWISMYWHHASMCFSFLSYDVAYGFSSCDRIEEELKSAGQYTLEDSRSGSGCAMCETAVLSRPGYHRSRRSHDSAYNLFPRSRALVRPMPSELEPQLPETPA